MQRDELRRTAFSGIVKFQIALAVLLFLSAGSLRFWQGWVYWIVFSAAVLFITAYFLERDPALVESRLKAGPGAEKEPIQKTIQLLASILFVALFAVPGIERRFHGASLSLPVVLTADALVALGFLVIFLVFRENGHASSIIEVKPGQRVVSTGPYRVVRHPMYAGAALMILATPLALGSLWGLACAVPLVGVLAARLIAEERYLAEHLPGYPEYCQRVGYRLVPYVW